MMRSMVATILGAVVVAGAGPLSAQSVRLDAELPRIMVFIDSG